MSVGAGRGPRGLSAISLLAALILVPGGAPQPQGCTLPPHPRHGYHEPGRGELCPVDLAFSAFCRSVPGTSVPHGWTLRVTCDPLFSPLASDDAEDMTSTCVRGQWKPSLPSCVAQCLPLQSDSVRVECEVAGAAVDCEAPVPLNTSATPHCRHGYTPDPGLATAGAYNVKILCNQDGEWSSTLPECKPTCGVSTRGSRATSSSKTSNTLEEHPWHAAIYKRSPGTSQEFKYSCGGSLVTVRHVLTVSSCVESLLHRGVAAPETYLRVALAKRHRSWTQRDRYQVTRQVAMIRTYPGYRNDSDELQSDIALLLLDDFVEVTSVVMPVCLDLSHTLSLTDIDTAYMVIWNKTQTREEDRELVMRPVAVLQRETCTQRLRPAVSALPAHKICALKGPGPNLDKLDNGAGLTSVFFGLHHLFGIMSTKLNDVVITTNITWDSHGEWIAKLLKSMEKDGK